MEQVAYVLVEGDGTSWSGSGKDVGIALTIEDAEKWKQALSKGSWNYRMYHPLPIMKGKE